MRRGFGEGEWESAAAAIFADDCVRQTRFTELISATAGYGNATGAEHSEVPGAHTDEAYATVINKQLGERRPIYRLPLKPFQVVMVSSCQRKTRRVSGSDFLALDARRER
jgi:hypothetical protein